MPDYNYVADLRNFENVPLKNDIVDSFGHEVRPMCPTPGWAAARMRRTFS
jgi:hypothetical protein